MAVSADEAVRQYLVALRNPEKLRDEARIKELSKRLESSDDALERVQLRAEIAQAEAPGTDTLEEHFVTHAKQWASEHGVSAAAFRQEGVPRTVLRRAGLENGRGRKGKGKGTQQRGPRVSRDDVAKAIPKRQPFTIAEVVSASGGSPGTVRKVVNELLAKGELEEVGVAQDHKGPGRAPTSYKRARA